MTSWPRLIILTKRIMYSVLAGCLWFWCTTGKGWQNYPSVCLEVQQPQVAT